MYTILDNMAPTPTANHTPAAPTESAQVDDCLTELLSWADKCRDLGVRAVIAEAMRTSKRMIYYYFGSKEGLYVAVLEEAYRRMRSIESELHLDDLPPVKALEALVAFTFDHHNGNQDYVRLVMSENILRGQYIAQSASIQALNVPAIQSIRRLYDRGVAEGVFRAGLDPLDIHANISALSFFNVSNQYTFGQIFKLQVQDPQVVAQRKANVMDMVVRYVRA